MIWLNYLPSGLPQVLKEETYACSCYAPVDSIESQELFLTGQQLQYSRRRVAQGSGTTSTQGNDEQTVFDWISKHGLVLESSWPQRSDMTDAEYYTPPTPAEEAILEAEGQAWLKKWQVIQKFDVPFSAIADAPLVAWINEGLFLHFIEVLSNNWYYDSEYNHGHIGVTPPLGFVIKYHQIIIKRKDQRMLVFFQVKGNPTLWTLDDGQWVGFADQSAFDSYVNGRPTSVVELDQAEFNKVQINPSVHKS